MEIDHATLEEIKIIEDAKAKADEVLQESMLKEARIKSAEVRELADKS